MLKSPYPYFGGKFSVAPLIWKRLGDVPNLVLPFFGSGAELWARPHWSVERGMFVGRPARIETVNDRDGFIANFNRALRLAPDALAEWAADPVNETDLHARHKWLVLRRDELEGRLRDDPDYYDVRAAGWWVWGISQWIGSGWCTRIDWQPRPGLGNAGNGVQSPRLSQQLPRLAGGRRVGALRLRQKLPHLGDGGRGAQRVSLRLAQKRPHLGGAGKGAQRVTLRQGGRVEGLRAYFGHLSRRLEGVRVCAGDWSRVVGYSATTMHGLTGIVLDPPYSAAAGRDGELYAVEDLAVAHEVRAWCLEEISDERAGFSGPRYRHPLLRLALCGYEGEHEMPADWDCVAWSTGGGYSNQSVGNENKHRERIWFSPGCLPAEPAAQQLALF